ncbi:MAG: RHS repeat protein, partial [Akkermansia sp.]|nr:RHS repeat protein [Akkermansia sp.]
MNTPYNNDHDAALLSTGASASRAKRVRTVNFVSLPAFSQRPSEGGMKNFVGGTLTLPAEGARVTMRITADDSGSFTLAGSSASLSVSGGVDENNWQKSTSASYWQSSITAFLPGGDYNILATCSNIDMAPYNDENLFLLRCGLSIEYPVDSHDADGGLPDVDDDSVDEPSICDPCACCSDTGDAVSPPTDVTPAAAQDECGGAVSVVPGAAAAAMSLAAVNDSSSPGASPGVATGMRYDSVWAWQAQVQDGLLTIRPSSGRRMTFTVVEGEAVARPTALTLHHPVQVELQNADLTPCSEGSPAFWTLTEASGRRVRFDAASGTVAAVVAASGRVTTAVQHAEQVQELFDDAGNMVSCYSPTQGLMLVSSGASGEKLLSWYAPADVTVDAEGNVQPTGAPYKTASYLTTVTADGVESTSVTREQTGLPAYTVTRVVDGDTVTVTKGTGADAIIRTWVTTRPEVGLLQRVETVRKGSAEAPPVSCSCMVRMLTEGGWLKLSDTEGYGSTSPRTTSYEYNQQYRVSRVNHPDGSYTEFAYDAEGRVTHETAPWGADRRKRTRYVYAASSSRFFDNRPVKVYTDYQKSDGSWLNIKVVDYSYEDSAALERTTAVTHIAGTSQVQTTVEERYGEAPAYAFAAGKSKFSQGVDGVQSYHDYEAANEYGALHKHTVITKAAGECVAGQSRMREEFIAADDTVTFERESVWDGEHWQLLSSAAYEYDAQRRVVKTTYGNGRVATAAWMCCGKLRETDEDGVTTTYGYNAAHQLEEVIRAEVKDGDVVVTPETITTYTRDAADRVLSTRRDTGAMTTIETLQYDLLGREVSRTDALGRTTTTAYSADGLT